MIPPFEPDTGNLPPGVHTATWEELDERFGYNERRAMLLAGLREALSALRAAGCSRVYIDGSFVTSKEEPIDFDACWDTRGVNMFRLVRDAPVLLRFQAARAEQKALYRGEIFPANWPADASGTTFLDFFQRVKGTEGPKGIILIPTSML